MLITALVFVLILSGLVIAHELGHFWVAKLAKIRVEQFSIFFPPHIFKKKIGETEYALGSIPLGGYVKLYGEDEQTQGKGSFASASVATRLTVIIAGVVMNLLLAVTLLTVGFSIGMPPVVSTPSQLGLNVPTNVIITTVEAGSAANQAGVVTGDTVLGFESAAALQDFTASHRGQTVPITISHAGVERTVLPHLAISGPAFGVGLAEATIIKTNPITALRISVVETGHIVMAMGRFLKDFVVGLFGHAKIAPEVTGPVGIFVFTGEAIQLGFTYVIQLAAMISVNLALVNVIPFPGLDGGRALFVVLEGIFRRKVVHERYEAIAHAVGFWLLMIFFIAITVRDIGRFF